MSFCLEKASLPSDLLILSLSVLRCILLHHSSHFTSSLLPPSQISKAVSTAGGSSMATATGMNNKRNIQNFASNTSGVPRPCLPPLSALKPVPAWSYSPSTRHLNLPGCVWNMHFHICFGGLFPTGTSHTDTLGRMRRRTVESTAPTSAASSLLPSRISLMVCKCLSFLDHRKVARLSPARVVLCAARMFSCVPVGFCKEICTYCMKFHSMYT